MEAINGNVFIRRDLKEDHGFSVEISEKALTSSLVGEITHIESDKIVGIGDRVHLPHYNVKDALINGDEYAVVKYGELFAKEEGDTFIPLNRFVKTRKCENDHIRDDKGDVALFMTDGFIETTNWVEIIDVADDCEWFTEEDIGSFCVAPENDQLLA